MAEQVKISAYDNGPYLVTGPAIITDADGNEYPNERDRRAVPLRGVHQQAILRWHALQSRLSGGPEGRPGVAPTGRRRAARRRAGVDCEP